MFYKILSQQPHNISIEEAKRQCSIMPEFKLDDDLISHLIDASFEVAQKYTKKALSIADASVYSESSQVRLSYGQCHSIKKIIYSLNGQKTILFDSEVSEEVSGFSFNEFNNTVTIDANLDHVIIDYSVGYKCIPKQVLQGIYLMVNTLYLNRENISVGEGGVSDIPLNSMYLWDSIREHQI